MEIACYQEIKWFEEEDRAVSWHASDLRRLEDSEFQTDHRPFSEEQEKQNLRSRLICFGERSVVKCSELPLPGCSGATQLCLLQWGFVSGCVPAAACGYFSSGTSVEQEGKAEWRKDGSSWEKRSAKVKQKGKKKWFFFNSGGKKTQQRRLILV